MSGLDAVCSRMSISESNDSSRGSLGLVLAGRLALLSLSVARCAYGEIPATNDNYHAHHSLQHFSQ
jgi:hypothetical protein